MTTLHIEANRVSYGAKRFTPALSVSEMVSFSAELFDMGVSPKEIYTTLYELTTEANTLTSALVAKRLKGAPSQRTLEALLGPGGIPDTVNALLSMRMRERVKRLKRQVVDHADSAPEGDVRR